MSPIDFEYCAMLIYRLKLSNRVHYGQVLYDFQINCGDVSVYSLKKNSGWRTNKYPLVSSVELITGLLLIMPGYDSCEEQHMVGMS